MTDIGLMVRSANPVPDDSQALTNDELSAVLLLAHQRSGEMDTKQAPPIVAPEKKIRSGWLVAAAAFAVVIVVFGATIVFGNVSSDEPPATTPTTEAPPTTEASPPTTEASPTTVAEPAPTTTIAAEADDALTQAEEGFVTAFVEAFNARDEADILALVASDAKATSYVLFESAPETWARELQWRWALDETWTAESCKKSFSAITCQVIIDGGFSAGLEAQRANLRMTVVDGVATNVTLQEDLATLIPRSNLLRVWLDSEHPDKVATMLADLEPPSPPALTDESIALWQELLPQYRASQDG